MIVSHTFQLFAGVSLLIQDSEIAESLGVTVPMPSVVPSSRVDGQSQASQENRRRASTGSSTISDTGSSNEVDSGGRMGFNHQPFQCYGM